MNDFIATDGQPYGQVIIFLDLDNNIFQSGSKCGGLDTVPVAYKTTGEACGFMTKAQETLFHWLSQTTLVIPNTARDTATFKRCTLPFKSYSICSFGGVILCPDGEVEPQWHSIIESAVSSSQQTLSEVYSRMLDIAGQNAFDIRPRFVNDVGLDLYISVKHNRRDNGELIALGGMLKPFIPSGWTVHFNDNNLAIFPDCLGKEKASQWLLENILKPAQGSLVIGSGDSFTDVPFMANSDFVLVPSNSQVFKSLVDHSTEIDSSSISR